MSVDNHLMFNCLLLGRGENMVITDFIPTYNPNSVHSFVDFCTIDWFRQFSLCAPLTSVNGFYILSGLLNSVALIGLGSLHACFITVPYG